MQALGLRFRQGQGRDVDQRRLDGKQIFKKRRTMPHNPTIIQGNRLLFAKWSGGEAAKRRDVSDGSQVTGQIAGKAAHVSSLSRGHLEGGMIGVGLVQKFESMNVDRPGFEAYRLIGIGQGISALSAHLDRRIDWGYLLDLAGELA